MDRFELIRRPDTPHDRIEPEPFTACPTPATGRRLMFAVVSFALFIIAVDQTVVATALSAIQADLGSAINWTGWTITVYAVGQILVMPMAGRLSTQFGPRRVLLAGVAAFTAASLCCGLAGSIHVLLAFRAVQALGAGAIVPAATGMVAEGFGSNRDRALGMFNSIFSVGAVVGPLVGGLCVHYWSWRGVFWINVPFSALLLAMGVRFLPRIGRGPRQRVDVRGATLFAGGVLAAMLAITTLGSQGTSPANPMFVAACLFGVLFITLFLVHAGRAAAPFIPLRLLYGKGFGVMNLVNFLYGVSALAFGSLVPLYAERRYNLDPLQGGSLLTARAIGIIAIGGISVMAMRRTGYRWPILFGMLTIAGGLAMTATSPRGTSVSQWLLLGAGITGLGMGLMVPASNNASLQLAPELAAAIAGLRGMFRQCGSIVSVSVTTAVLSRSTDPGGAQALVFLIITGLILCAIPLVLMVPDHKGSW